MKPVTTNALNVQTVVRDISRHVIYAFYEYYHHPAKADVGWSSMQHPLLQVTGSGELLHASQCLVLVFSCFNHVKWPVLLVYCNGWDIMSKHDTESEISRPYFPFRMLGGNRFGCGIDNCRQNRRCWVEMVVASWKKKATKHIKLYWMKIYMHINIWCYILVKSTTKKKSTNVCSL